MTPQRVLELLAPDEKAVCPYRIEYIFSRVSIAVNLRVIHGGSMILGYFTCDTLDPWNIVKFTPDRDVAWSQIREVLRAFDGQLEVNMR